MSEESPDGGERRPIEGRTFVVFACVNVVRDLVGRLEAQERVCQEYVTEQGGIVRGTVRSMRRARSYRDFDPGLARAVDLLQSGDVLLAANAARFSRNADVMAELLSRVSARGATVETTDGAYTAIMFAYVAE